MWRFVVGCRLGLLVWIEIVRIGLDKTLEGFGAISYHTTNAPWGYYPTSYI
jgi:hypothetical protein